MWYEDGPFVARRAEMDPDNLRAVPLFASMAEPDLRRIATFASEDSVPAGGTLMREGDYSNEMVAIESGTADVIQGGRTVASLAPGDVFGEMGVLERELRTASIVARSPMRLIRLTTWDVKRLPEETRARLVELVRSRRPPDPTDSAAAG
jgi:CRP/FNR family transcriptional regulator, cyclic AMP receptor protein